MCCHLLADWYILLIEINLDYDIYIYIYIKLAVLVNIATKSVQHVHARMITIIVEKVLT